MAITLDGTNGISTPDVEPTGSTVPTNGLYLPAANSVGIATNSSERVRVDSSGNVGIGGTPVKTLSVLPTSIRRMDFYVRNPGTDDALVIHSQHATNNNIRDMILEGSFLRFFTGADSGSSGSESMRIDSSGNLLVGTTSTISSAAFTLVGNVANNVAYIRNTNSAPYGLRVNYSAVTPNNTDFWFYYASDATAARYEVRSNGGIANYSANNVNLSDRREKMNFAPAGNYLAKICAIPVQTFNYIDQNLEEDNGLTLGVVAQDVQAVAPELVMESNWAAKDQEPKMRLSIYQTDLQYALMKCIQEQQAIIEQQSQAIASITTRIAALEAK